MCSGKPGIVESKLRRPAEVTQNRGVIAVGHDMATSLSEYARRNIKAGGGQGSGSDEAPDVLISQVAIVPALRIQEKWSSRKSYF